MSWRTWRKFYQTNNWWLKRLENVFPTEAGFNLPMIWTRSLNRQCSNEHFLFYPFFVCNLWKPVSLNHNGFAYTGWLKSRLFILKYLCFIQNQFLCKFINWFEKSRSDTGLWYHRVRLCKTREWRASKPKLLKIILCWTGSFSYLTAHSLKKNCYTVRF